MDMTINLKETTNTWNHYYHSLEAPLRLFQFSQINNTKCTFQPLIPLTLNHTLINILSRRCYWTFQSIVTNRYIKIRYFLQISLYHETWNNFCLHKIKKSSTKFHSVSLLRYKYIKHGILLEFLNFCGSLPESYGMEELNKSTKMKMKYCNSFHSCLIKDTDNESIYSFNILHYTKCF